MRIPRGALPGRLIEGLGSLISRLAADAPPKRVPSGPERRFGDISVADCPERVGDDHEPEGGTTDDFRERFCVIAGSGNLWENPRRLLEF